MPTWPIRTALVEAAASEPTSQMKADAVKLALVRQPPVVVPANVVVSTDESRLVWQQRVSYTPGR